jgi:hypothetical protein
VYRDGEYSRALVLGEPRPVPSVLSLIYNYDPTAKFVDELHKQVSFRWRSGSKGRRAAKGRPPIFRSYWDFTLIKSISAPVALMIASEYDRVRKRGGWRPYALEFEKWDPAVRSMLDDVGFLSLCGVTEHSEPILEGRGWRILRMQAGTSADGERVGKLLHQLGFDTIWDDPSLYEALVEALANTRHHAYPHGHIFPEPHYPGWWMTGYIDENAKSMTIVVYDHGVTIPGTLSNPENNWELYPKWRRFVMRAAKRFPAADETALDGALIAAAMKVGRTSTGLSFRGRGLKTFEHVLDQCRAGRLTIRSRCGEYVMEKGSKARYRTQPAAINGTLITWRLDR